MTAMAVTWPRAATLERQSHIDAAWLEETRRRLDAIASGTATWLDAEMVDGELVAELDAMYE